MADTAPHLVDRVLPRVPIRQWVLSFPFQIRFLLAFDVDLRRAVRHLERTGRLALRRAVRGLGPG